MGSRAPVCTMRLLTVTHFFGSHGGGIELVAVHLNRELAALGHHTSWAAADEGAEPDMGATRPVKLRCVNWLEQATGLPMPIPLPGSIWRLWHAVAQSDAVIVHDALYVSSILGLLAARWHRKPAILIQHIAEIPFSNRLMRAVMALATGLVTRPMLRAADQVFFISATVRDRFKDVRLRRPARLQFNGVDSDLFHPAGPAGVPRDGTILFVGRFVEKKGLSILAELARLRPELRFVLAGRGPIDPKTWGLPNVTVLPHQSPRALSDLYRRASLLLLPSVGEGFPLVVQEAMASGLPVVCGKDTAAADPEASRWFASADIDLGDPRGTASRIAAVIDALPADPPPPEMAEQASRRYSWPGMASAIVDTIVAMSQPGIPAL